MLNNSFRNHKSLLGSWAFWVSLGAFFTLVLNPGSPVFWAMAQQAQREEKTGEVPKPPKDDFTVSVYKALDEKKAEKLTFKDKYKVDKADEDVEVIISYYNWSVNADDFWNRQLNIEIKTKEGFVVEKISKSGFGELGYVKTGEKKTLDSYKKEKITVSGGTATATMLDMEIGKAENDRYHNLLGKFVLKK